MPQHTEEERRKREQQAGLQRPSEIRDSDLLSNLSRVRKLERLGLDEAGIKQSLEAYGFNSAQIRTLLIARKREQAGLGTERPQPLPHDPIGSTLRRVSDVSSAPSALIFSAIPGTEAHQIARQRRAEGQNFFRAALSGFREADLPPGVKLGAQILLDPLNLIPVVGFPGAVARGVRAATRGAGAAARGGVRAAERVGTAGIREAVPETLEQAVARVRPDAEQLAKASSLPTVGQRVAGIRAGEVVAPVAPRSRSIAELREAGGGIPKRPGELTAVGWKRAIEQNLEDSKLLRRIERKATRVFDDLDEFGEAEIEFLEDELVPEKFFADITLTDVTKAVREGIGANESHLPVLRAGLAKRLAEDATAEADAIQRGISKVGLQEPPPAVERISVREATLGGRAVPAGPEVAQAVPPGSVARRAIPSGEARNLGQLERQAVEGMSDDELVARFVSDTEAAEIAKQTTFEGAIPPVGISGLRGRGATDFSATQLDVFGEMVRRIDAAHDPLVALSNFARRVPDTARFVSGRELARELLQASRLEPGSLTSQVIRGMRPAGALTEAAPAGVGGAPPGGAAPEALTRTGETSRLTQSRRFRIFDVTDPQADLIALESGGVEGALGGVRRFEIFDEASRAPQITIAARRFPAGKDVFEVEVRGLDAAGRPLSFNDPAMRGTFSSHDVAEIAQSVMDELRADRLVGFRLSTGAPRDITRQQVDTLLSRTVEAAPVLRRGLGGASPPGAGPPTATGAGATTPPQLPRGPRTDFPPTNSSLYDSLLHAHLDAPDAQTLLRGAAEALEDVPGAGHLIRATNPSALARENPVLREAIGYRLVEQVQDATMNNRLAQFAQAVPFDVDDVGRIATSRGKVAFGDVAENPSRFGLTPEQREWIESAHVQIDFLAKNYEDVSGKTLRQDLEREHYWPRFVRQEGAPTIRSRVGSRQSPINERLIPTMEEGLERGVPYESNPVLQLQLYMQAIQKMTRDELLIQRLKQKGLARSRTSGRVTRNELLPDEIADFDIVMDREAAAILQGPLGSPQGLLRPAEAVSGISRQLVTGLLDAGQFFIQMLPLLATSPRNWGRAVGISLRTLVQPRFFQQWVAQSPEARRVAPFGVDPGLSSEFFEATPLLGRIPGLGRVLGPLSRGAQRTFESALGAGRILYADGLMEAAIATGAGRDELFRIARQADTLLGTPSTKSLGISATQRQVENAFLFFSSRYTRSVFGTVAYLFGKGFGPQQVRKTMAKLALGGAATYYGLAKAAGMSERDILEGLNPASGKRFMSINIGGANFGLGGAYRSLVAAIGGLTNKRSWDFDNWAEALIDNPLVRYMRSRSSPLTGTLVDFLDQQDFIGRPFSLDAFADNSDLLVDQLIQRGAPFPIQGLLEVQGGIGTRAAALGGEAVGLRVSPTTFSDAADQVTRDIGLGFSYRDLEPYQKEIVENDPRVQRVKQGQRRSGTFKELQQVDDDYQGKIDALVRYAQGPAPAGLAPKGSFNYRNAIVGTFYDLEAERANLKEGIRRDAGITFGDGSSESEQDLTRWYGLVDEAKAESGGVLLPGALEGKRLALQQQIGSTRFRFVLRNIFLRHLPQEILQYLSPTAQAWRRRAEAERTAHSTGRASSVGFGGTGTTSQQILDAIRGR